MFISNVFLKENGQIKLGDFGVSTEYDEDSTTICSTYVGTHSYMSPEIKSHKKYTYKTDCWFDFITINLRLFHFIFF